MRGTADATPEPPLCFVPRHPTVHNVFSVSPEEGKGHAPETTPVGGGSGARRTESTRRYWRLKKASNSSSPMPSPHPPRAVPSPAARKAKGMSFRERWVLCLNLIWREVTGPEDNDASAEPHTRGAGEHGWWWHMLPTRRTGSRRVAVSMGGWFSSAETGPCFSCASVCKYSVWCEDKVLKRAPDRCADKGSERREDRGGASTREKLEHGVLVDDFH